MQIDSDLKPVPVCDPMVEHINISSREIKGSGPQALLDTLEVSKMFGQRT